jgi:hypothetical protein
VRSLLIRRPHIYAEWPVQRDAENLYGRFMVNG